MYDHETAPESPVTVKILGPGCGNCRRLEAHTRQALDQLGVHSELVKVEDISEIMDYGVMSTPALVLGREVLVAGRVPSIPEVAKMLADKL